MNQQAQQERIEIDAEFFDQWPDEVVFERTDGDARTYEVTE